MNVSFLNRLFTVVGTGLAAITAVLFICLQAMAAEGIHSHGQGSMQILQVENQWQFTLSLPLDDALGFEHAPETEEQKSQLQQFVSLAKTFTRFIEVEGNCSLQTATVHLPWSSHSDDEFISTHEQGHDEEHHENEHGHNDLEAVYRIDCQDSIDAIKVSLSDISPSLVSINTQWSTEKGQGMQVITSNEHTLFLGR